MEIDKNKLTDDNGRPLTQGLFLEVKYDTNYAVFTEKPYDFKYKGTTYPSLKKLYLAHEDPTEYDFACTYLLGWEHWQRICRNKRFGEMVKGWREELELKLRSQAVRDIIELSSGDKGFQAAKWIADKGWDKRLAGRPSKEDIDREVAMQTRISDEYNADVTRLFKEG